MISSILAQIGYEVARTQHLSRSASSNSSSCSVWERQSSILTQIGCEVARTQHLSCSARNSICSVRLATTSYSSILGAFSLRLVTRSHALCRVAPAAAVAASSMGGYSNILAQIAYEVARMQYRSSIGSCCRRPAAIQERPVAALAAAVASMQAS